MSFTKEMRDTFSRHTHQMEDALANVYNLLDVSHHNVEKIYADAVQNKIVGKNEKMLLDAFNDALRDIPMIREYVRQKMKGLEAAPEYTTMQKRIDDYVFYVDGLRMSIYLIPEDEYIYRGAYYATFTECPKLTGVEEWTSKMSQLLTEWNFWQATLAGTHGYPSKALYGRDASYNVLDDYAYKVMQLYDELEYSEETASALEWAATMISKLRHNNIELVLSSFYEKNYFKNKDGNKNENNRSIEENPDKNDPQIHSDNME